MYQPVERYSAIVALLFFFATIVYLSLSYINVHLSIVTKVETNHIEQFLQIFYRVILALSRNKRKPPPSLSPNKDHENIFSNS